MEGAGITRVVGLAAHKSSYVGITRNSTRIHITITTTLAFTNDTTYIFITCHITSIHTLHSSLSRGVVGVTSDTTDIIVSRYTTCVHTIGGGGLASTTTRVCSHKTAHIIVSFHRAGIHSVIQCQVALATHNTAHIVFSFHTGTVGTIFRTESQAIASSIQTTHIVARTCHTTSAHMNVFRTATVIVSMRTKKSTHVGRSHNRTSVHYNISLSETHTLLSHTTTKTAHTACTCNHTPLGV